MERTSGRRSSVRTATWLVLVQVLDNDTTVLFHPLPTAQLNPIRSIFSSWLPRWPCCHQHLLLMNSATRTARWRRPCYCRTTPSPRASPTTTLLMTTPPRTCRRRSRRRRHSRPPAVSCWPKGRVPCVVTSAPVLSNGERWSGERGGHPTAPVEEAESEVREESIERL